VHNNYTADYIRPQLWQPNIPPHPPYSRHCSDIVYWNAGGQRRTRNDRRLLPKAQTIDILLTAARKHFDLPQLRWPCFYTFFTINGPIQEIQLWQRNLTAVNYNLVNGCKTWSSRDCHRESLQKANDLYIGWSDVTESAVTIRSPFCGYNMA